MVNQREVDTDPDIKQRPSWDEYFSDMAKLVATRATCPRRSVGSVIVHQNRVCSTGYNGSISGGQHCTDVGCLMVDNHCVRTNHAEANAIAFAARFGVPIEGATIYITTRPCVTCAKLIASSGLKEVVLVDDNYPDMHSLIMLQHAGVTIRVV